MSELEKLSDREIDALVAEKVMGRAVMRGRFADGRDWYRVEGREPWNYSTDDNAARILRNRMFDLDLHNQFEFQLARRVEMPTSGLAMMQATPRNQCLAALMAIKPAGSDAARSPEAAE